MILAGRAPRVRAEVIRALETDIFPKLGNVPLEGLDWPQLENALNRIVDRGTRVAANWTQQALRQGSEAEPVGAQPPGR